ncbi:hypothetical protein [Clostridium sp.]|uniref:hypothetical protein n=1 Tax=Clostridium sp. TaxID=1506 RepID=UPI003F4C21A2
MKLRRNQIFVLAIAFVFISFGIAQSIFNFDISRKFIDNISFVLIMIAAGLLLIGRKKK